MKSFRTHMFYLGSADIISRLLGFCAVTYLARIFGASNMGVFAIGMSILAYASILINMGLPILGVRSVATKKATIPNLLKRICFARFFLSIAAFIIGTGMLIILVEEYNTKKIAIIYLISMFPSALLLEWLFLGLNKMKLLSIGRIIGISAYLFIIIGKVSNSEDIAGIEKVLKGDGPWVVEQVVPYKIELSVIVGYDGKTKLVTFPPTENIHENGILRISISPARISMEIRRRAQDLAQEVIKNIGDPGVFCVEMFLLENEELLVNEIAPRPHNSGHHTIDSFTVSQYELQIRALVGLPLVNPQQITSSVLLNVLGEEYTNLTDSYTTNWILKNQNARIYSYGKSDVRPGRKMGHILFSGASQEDLFSDALETHKILTKV